MIERRLRGAALFLLPVALLGLSPRTVPVAAIITVGYASAAFMLRRRSTSFVAGWGYALVAITYLLIVMGLTSDLNELGRSKATFVAFITFPFAVSVAYLIEETADIRFLLWGFVATSAAIATVSIPSINRGVLGIERYQWQGNLNAISAIVLMQFWLIRRKAVAIPLMVLSLAGVAVAAAKQAVAVVIVGTSANVAAKVTPSRRQASDIASIGVLLILLVAFWGVISNLPIMETMLSRFGRLRTATGGFTLLQRQLMYVKAGRCFLANPGTGIGLGQFVSYPGWTAEQPGELHIYPHNAFLEILCEQGVVGFAVLIMPLMVAAGLAFWHGLRSEGEPLYAALLLFLAGCTMSSITGDMSARTVWVFGMILIRMLSLRGQQPADRVRPIP